MLVNENGHWNSTSVYFFSQEYLRPKLKSISDAVLSQHPSPKNFLQKFLSLILTNLDQIHRDLLKTREKNCKKFLDLGYCNKTVSENDSSFFQPNIEVVFRYCITS